MAPTAQQRPAVAHQTPNSSALAPPAGSASTVSDHFLPFQCSAIGSSVVVPTVAAPTAQQLDVLVQDTPLRNVRFEAAPGLAATRHLDPFQPSISTLVSPCAL